jgi:hypothetical protein
VRLRGWGELKIRIIAYARRRQVFDLHSIAGGGFPVGKWRLAKRPPLDFFDAALPLSYVKSSSLKVPRLGQKVDAATATAVGRALETLRSEADLAAQAMHRIRRLTLWQSAWQHLWMALVAIAITLLAVWWYVPSVTEMNALRAEREQLQASIADLSQRGGRIKLNSCGNSGERKRLCVLVDQTAGRFGNTQSGEIYMIAKGY